MRIGRLGGGGGVKLSGQTFFLGGAAAATSLKVNFCRSGLKTNQKEGR